jgi:hypothetical protein
LRAPMSAARALPATPAMIIIVIQVETSRS